MNYIRKAKLEDASRLAEIEIFNYRLNFYPIFKNDFYYFNELQVATELETYRCHSDILANTYVYDDGVVKGFIRIDDKEIKKLFVEPVLQNQKIGSALLEYAIQNYNIKFLWALEKNKKAICFYETHGFHRTNDKKIEEDTTKFLIRLQR
ncbi:MAG: GNAT family N-acetyltransferase [Oscillospiraceae bacterium]|nr:GNAT family N-acetyltransferase [Ruminococcus sp.]MDE6706709.1 GNAT family N-acetyltransferase [Oscillospiraceae bacterium]